PSNGSWTKQGQALVASGSAAPWTIRTAGSDKWTDYKLSVGLTIRKATPKPDFPVFHGEFDRYLPREWFWPFAQHCGQYRYRYYAGEFDWGSDAAIFVRYRSRLDCYRVQLSTRYQEIILWHGVGGYLQVVPCKLEQGKSYRLDVTARGANIQVSLDGKKMIDYWHPTLPTLSGRIGLGAYHSTVAFEKAVVTKFPPSKTAPPAHQAKFQYRRWRTVSWIFDGNEPICLLEKTRCDKDPKIKGALYYYLVKLRPGYRPYLHTWIGI
ncbi:unnamed protein product, partial [marine sediment metagenome]